MSTADRIHPTNASIVKAIHHALLQRPLTFNELSAKVKRITSATEDIPNGYLRNGIQTYRRHFTDEHNALVLNQGDWTYEITDDPAKIKLWQQDRARSMKSGAITMLAQAEIGVAVTNGRSRDGKKARELHEAVENLIGKLDEVLSI